MRYNLTRGIVAAATMVCPPPVHFGDDPNLPCAALSAGLPRRTAGAMEKLEARMC
jgi:hypothetical protein